MRRARVVFRAPRGGISRSRGENAPPTRPRRVRGGRARAGVRAECGDVAGRRDATWAARLFVSRMWRIFSSHGRSNVARNWRERRELKISRFHKTRDNRMGTSLRKCDGNRISVRQKTHNHEKSAEYSRLGEFAREV